MNRLKVLRFTPEHRAASANAMPAATLSAAAWSRAGDLEPRTSWCTLEPGDLLR